MSTVTETTALHHARKLLRLSHERLADYTELLRDIGKAVSHNRADPPFSLLPSIILGHWRTITETLELPSDASLLQVKDTIAALNRRVTAAETILLRITDEICDYSIGLDHADLPGMCRYLKMECGRLRALSNQRLDQLQSLLRTLGLPGSDSVQQAGARVRELKRDHDQLTYLRERLRHILKLSVNMTSDEDLLQAAARIAPTGDAQ